MPIGTLLNLKYVYILSKQDGVWTLIIHYEPGFNELVPDRVDFDQARYLYDASQIGNSAGAIYSGCRVDVKQELYWRRDETRGVEGKLAIYHYVAASRYVSRQSECSADANCKDGKFCNAGIDLALHQCIAKKADDDTCELVGGGHQCKCGHCKLSRCYTPHSVAMGGAWHSDDACKQGRCSAIDGVKATCVCKEGTDCGSGYWCDAGADLKANGCRVKLAKGAKCGTAASLGNDHKCKSGACPGFPNYVCK